MNTKIIIEVYGGNITAVSSSNEIDIIILDYDNAENGSPFDGGVLSQDALFEPGSAHELFTADNDQVAIEVKEYLKRINF